MTTPEHVDTDLERAIFDSTEAMENHQLAVYNHNPNGGILGRISTGWAVRRTEAKVLKTQEKLRALDSVRVILASESILPPASEAPISQADIPTEQLSLRNIRDSI